MVGADLAYILYMSTYPLEWGWHTSPQPNSSSSSEWKPKPTLIGGADPDADKLQVAQLKCEGMTGSSGCQFGGSYGASAMYYQNGRKQCFDCAVKERSIEGLPGDEQVRILRPHLIGGK